MEERMKKCREVSPERVKKWTQKSSKSRKVGVVYYLCRNQQLEHPHFMEVPLSSSHDHLLLRDVIERLNALRGKGIASSYSWSCKRSYKNGYVWHDLSDDDVIHPAHGNEYVLKGSELFQEPNPAGGINPVTTLIAASTQTDDGLSSEPHQKQRIETLESLITADVRKLNSFRRMLEEEGYRIPSNTKLKVANTIMQMVSCGSISIKDPSQLFSTSLKLGETDCTAQKSSSMCSKSKKVES